MYLSVVIPAFNEKENIASMFSELENTIISCKQVTDYELILVDDHSSDGTLEEIKKYNSAKIKGLRLSRRSGSHTALRAGILKAKGDAVLCVSADGQDNPEVLQQMLDKLRQGNHTVWAIRTARNEPFFQKLFATFFYKILIQVIGEMDTPIDLANADFYLLSRKVVNAINQCPERNTSLFGLIVWLGFKQDFVPYERRSRMSGESKWNFKSKMRLAKDWIIAFSGLPLKIMSAFGIFIATIGLMYAIYIFIYAMLGFTTPGWAETAILLLVSSGILMIMLGVIGEYLWRALDETRKRPLFFTEEEI